MIQLQTVRTNSPQMEFTKSVQNQTTPSFKARRAKDEFVDKGEDIKENLQESLDTINELASDETTPKPFKKIINGIGILLVAILSGVSMHFGLTKLISSTKNTKSMKKLGKNTEKAYKFVGEKISKAAKKIKSGVSSLFNKIKNTEFVQKIITKFKASKIGTWLIGKADKIKKNKTVVKMGEKAFSAKDYLKTQTKKGTDYIKKNFEKAFVGTTSAGAGIATAAESTKINKENFDEIDEVGDDD